MGKMTVIKQAWQRADRLKRAGVHNDALTEYRAAIKRANESGLSRAAKNALKEEAAKIFLEERTSTKTGIQQAFEEAASKKQRAKDVLKSWKEKAEYADAAETSKSYLIAKALGVSSDQIRFAIDMLDDKGLEGEARANAFIDIMDQLTEMVYTNERVDNDDITRMISMWDFGL